VGTDSRCLRATTNQEAVGAIAEDRGTGAASIAPDPGPGPPTRAGEGTAAADRSEGQTGVDPLDPTTTTIVESAGDETTNFGELRPSALTNLRVGPADRPAPCPVSSVGSG